MSAADAVSALYDAARDEDLTLLDELVERAGLGWKCQAKSPKGPCLYMNVGASRCGGCGAKPKNREEVSDG